MKSCFCFFLLLHRTTMCRPRFFLMLVSLLEGNAEGRPKTKSNLNSNKFWNFCFSFLFIACRVTIFIEFADLIDLFRKFVEAEISLKFGETGLLFWWLRKGPNLVEAAAWFPVILIIFVSFSDIRSLRNSFQRISQIPIVIP